MTRPGSAPGRWRQRSAGRHGPRRAKEKPGRRRMANGARCLPPLRPPGPKRARARGREPHCLPLRAVAAAEGAAASASPRLAARSSPGWRGTRASAGGRVQARAGEPSSPPRRGGGTTAPSPARRRSASARAARAGARFGARLRKRKRHRSAALQKSQSGRGLPHSKESGTGVPHSKKPKRQRAAALQKKAARDCRTT